MLYEGSRDFKDAFGIYGFAGYENVVQNAKDKQVKKYMPVFERVGFS